MEKYIPEATDVRALHAALALGHPVRLRYQDRDCPVTFVQMESTAPAVYVTALEARTGTEYAAVVPLNADIWTQLMAQLPG